MKILFLQNLIYPLRTPFFNLLGKKTSFSFKVIFLSGTYINRKWNISREKMLFPHQVLKGVKFTLADGDTFQHVINPGAFLQYFRNIPDLLVSIGWANPINWVFMFLSIVLGKKYAIWCESTINENTPKREFSRPLVRFFVRKACFCVVPGTRSAEYIQSLDRDCKIVVVPNAVDNNRFITKRRLDKDKKLKILFVGRFEKIKSLTTLLSSFKMVQALFSGKVELHLVGYGPFRDAIVNFIKNENIQNVKIVDYVRPSKMPEIYKDSDIFVLPSEREVWGFVVNEAMASGLPVVVSDKVGSSADLVQPGKNGFIFEVKNVEQLSEYLLKLLKDDKLRQSMGLQSLKIIKDYTYETMVDNFSKGVEKHVKQKVFIRLDDVFCLDKDTKTVLNIAKKVGVKLSVGVIPFKLDSETVKQLKVMVDNNLISIHQHGIFHTKNGRGELGAKDEIELLKKGKAKMKQLFGDYPKVISLPWQYHGRNTLIRLSRLGYKTVSANKQKGLLGRLAYFVGGLFQKHLLLWHHVSYHGKRVPKTRLHEYSTTVDFFIGYHPPKWKEYRAFTYDMKRCHSDNLGVLLHPYGASVNKKLLEKEFVYLKNNYEIYGL